MEKQYINPKRGSVIKARYGKEGDIEEAWKKIIQEKDKDARHKQSTSCLL